MCPFLSQASVCNVHIFSDVSERAISAVAYLEVLKEDNSTSQVGFLLGKAKVAPSHGHTISRLELCSAVLANNLRSTNSKVVLGYIHNEKRRFFTYVSNRTDKIRCVSHPRQWKHIPTATNPADVATREDVENLDAKEKMWLEGPKEFLQKPAVSEENLFILCRQTPTTK